MRINNLNDKMQFEHVVLMLPGGVIGDTPKGIHAPELLMDSTDDGDILAEHETQYVEDAREQGWKLESGWTGQHGYNGIHMHPSEYIGGRLAEHILCTPGLWVAFPVSMVLDMEPDGWALAYRPHKRPSGAYRCPCCGDDFVGTAYVCQECDGSGCEQTINGTGEVGFWECDRDDVTEEYDEHSTECGEGENCTCRCTCSHLPGKQQCAFCDDLEKHCYLCRKVGHSKTEPCMI